MNDPIKYSRRKMLFLSAKMTAAFTTVGFTAGCETSGSDHVCANPDEWNTAEAGLRKANAYTEKSPHPDKNCLNCAFFTSASSSSCGQCTIFNGPASESAHCSSWSAITKRVNVKEVS